MHNALLLCVDICAYNSNFRCKSRQARDSRFFFIIIFSKEKLSQLSARKFSRWLRDFEAFQQQKKKYYFTFFMLLLPRKIYCVKLSHIWRSGGQWPAIKTVLNGLILSLALLCVSLKKKPRQQKAWGVSYLCEFDHNLSSPYLSVYLPFTAITKERDLSMNEVENLSWDHEHSESWIFVKKGTNGELIITVI